MQYFRCKCGKCEAWSSMGVADCEVCSECGTTLATSPELHTPPAPHKFVTRYDETTGKPYEICIKCYETKAETMSEGKV